jgi:hypothetical protein
VTCPGASIRGDIIAITDHGAWVALPKGFTAFRTAVLIPGIVPDGLHVGDPVVFHASMSGTTWPEEVGT